MGSLRLYLAENPLPDKEASVFGPRPDADRASPEEVAAVMRELLQQNGSSSESNVAQASPVSSDASGDGV